MKKLTLVLLSISGLTTTALGKHFTVDHPEMKNLWGSWKKNHTKSYTEHEEPNRMKIFVENYNKIEEFNANPNNTHTLAINHFADLTEDQFAAQYLRYQPPSQSDRKLVVEEEENKRFLASLPASVDWRAKGAVTPVKNQAHCGACYSFSATGALEALHFIKTGKLLSFSEQQIINCDTYTSGCSGGNAERAFKYTSEVGIELESSNPFMGVAGTCNYVASKALKVNTGYVDVPKKNMNALLTALVSQPVAIALSSASTAFQFYKSGVITTNCTATINHAVLAVGYTTINGLQALIIKNSWGTGWGTNGYVYISTNGAANDGLGVCGVLYAPTYPTA